MGTGNSKPGYQFGEYFYNSVAEPIADKVIVPIYDATLGHLVDPALNVIESGTSAAADILTVGGETAGTVITDTGEFIGSVEDSGASFISDVSNILPVVGVFIVIIIGAIVWNQQDTLVEAGTKAIK